MNTIEMSEVGYEDLQTKSENISRNVKASSLVVNDDISAELRVGRNFMKNFKMKLRIK